MNYHLKLRGDYELKLMDKSWIEPLYWGSIFLGSGGGGNSEFLTFLLNEQFSKKPTLPLLDLDEIKNESEYATVGLMGSLIEETFPTGFEGINILERAKSSIKSNIDGLFTLEAAGVNILYPILVASLVDLPLIDGDAMGRAFPELHMTTFYFNKHHLIPFVISDSQGHYYDLNEKDIFMLELTARRIVSQQGGYGSFAGALTKGANLKRILIPRTISFAAELGKTFISPGSYSELIENLMMVSKNSLYGTAVELFIGIIERIENIENIDWETITIKGTNTSENSTFKILIKNENLIAYRNNKVAAMVPDLISIVNLETLKPVTNTELQEGMKVSVIGLPAPIALKKEKALEFIGPTAFGYKSRYESLEELYFSYYY